MAGPSRYAVYLAPQPASPLWRFGCEILGYDAATGFDVHGFCAAGLDAQAWRDMTARPRVYGFHGTLKAPFRLADGFTLADLVEGLVGLASRHPAFDAGPLVVSAIGEGAGGFVAFTLQRPCAELARLEQAVVEGLDRFRAALTPTEIAARRPDRLTARQRDNLACWGYPHVGADFRFHMTLTGETGRAADIADALAEIHARRLGSTHLPVDELVLFEQTAPGERFRIIRRFALA